MKVVVLGATGTIGLPVCQALVRAGHTVYGVTRTAEKAKFLVSEEVHPIVGDPTSSSWLHLVPTIDVVIQALGGGDPENSKAILDNLTEACQNSRRAEDPKISYIHASGTWLYGDNRTDTVSDFTPLNLPNSTPVGLVVTLNVPALEQRIIKSTAFRGIVLRAGVVYGRGGSILSGAFHHAATKGEVVAYGTPGVRTSAVHTDDLADLFVRASERASLVGGLTIVAASEVFSRDDFLHRLVEITNAKGPVKYLEPSDLFQQALASSQIARSDIAKSILGWSPKRTLVDNLETYYYSYLAAQKEEWAVQLVQKHFNIR